MAVIRDLEKINLRACPRSVAARTVDNFGCLSGEYLKCIIALTSPHSTTLRTIDLFDHILGGDL